MSVTDDNVTKNKNWYEN